MLTALAEGVPAQEIVVVCRSLARSGELFETALARADGVVVTSARQMPRTHTALGRALLALARLGALPGSAADGRRPDHVPAPPGIVEPADAVDQLEADMRRDGIQNPAALNARCTRGGLRWMRLMSCDGRSIRRRTCRITSAGCSRPRTLSGLS